MENDMVPINCWCIFPVENRISLEIKEEFIIEKVKFVIKICFLNTVFLTKSGDGNGGFSLQLVKLRKNYLR